ncbi:VOC family protein [Candidatus Thorarchaeota archaeon]|nr:MAG: VOC family protein [Candidatus Thorarchaeota archaeon]
MIKGIDVVFFYSRDLGQLIKWYQEMFDMDFSRDSQESDWAEFAFSEDSVSTRLAFHAWHENVQQKFMISFLVDDIHTLVKRLQEKGAELLGTPLITEIEDSFFATIRDPEGNIIQVSERK